MERIVIGTRGSALARWQTQWVADGLCAAQGDLEVEILPIVAPADAAPDVPIARLGTKGLFTKTLEDALLEGRIDLAVHSLKDLAAEMPPGLSLAAIPAREDPREAFVSAIASTLGDLPAGARVGTSAPRRRAQLLHLRPDLELCEIRGNVDTRLHKLATGQYDALVLAAAGLHRLQRLNAITAYLDPATLLPAGGQGALGIQARADDGRTLALAARLADRTATLCCQAERRLQALLEGGCRVPLGALATLDGATLTLEAVVATEDGATLVRDSADGSAEEPHALAERLAQRLLERGAGDILKRVRASQPQSPDT